MRDARRLVKALLAKEEVRRLGCRRAGVSEIKQHAFFASIDWSKLLDRTVPAPWVPNFSGPLDTRFFDSFAGVHSSDEEDRVAQSGTHNDGGDDDDDDDDDDDSPSDGGSTCSDSSSVAMTVSDSEDDSEWVDPHPGWDAAFDEAVGVQWLDPVSASDVDADFRGGPTMQQPGGGMAPLASSRSGLRRRGSAVMYTMSPGMRRPSSSASSIVTLGGLASEDFSALCAEEMEVWRGKVKRLKEQATREQAKRKDAESKAEALSTKLVEVRVGVASLCGSRRGAVMRACRSWVCVCVCVCVDVSVS